MEHIKTPKVENVRMLDRYSKTPSLGTLYLTATHLIFVDPDGKKETWVLHSWVAHIEKLPLTTTGSPLLIRTKTFLSVTFVIQKERDCHDIYLTLNQLSQPTNIQDLYCFTYNPPENWLKSEGWNFFDLNVEYQRMGVPNEFWCLTKLNKDYELCDTYPKDLYVPASASDSVLLGSSKFRSKGRLPVLCYLHPNMASISRCSQPLSGFSARCVEDEKMLHNVLKTNPNSNFMYVVDTRPKINAMANRAAGKGYENEAFYENIKFHFLGVENIHVMRSSLAKLVETCEQRCPTMNSFLAGLEASGWLRHIKAILDTSWFIAQAIEDGISVVVHCSDGWDRTAQVCSLAQLLLDPYYRTLAGYQTLIEKDWLAFGHKFLERCGHIQMDVKEISPVFTQLLDATWQLMQQFPCSFEFNEQFLLTLHDHVHSCQFGTFVGNCEKERSDLRLSETTYSLWGYINHHRNELLNPLYLVDESPGLLVPNLFPQNIRFWRGMYCKHETGVHPREAQSDILLATAEHTSSLDDHIKYLTQRLTSVKNLIRSSVGRQSKKSRKPHESSKRIDRYIYENKPNNVLEPSENNHPLMETINASSSPSNLQEVTKGIESVALDWKVLRTSEECSCSVPFDNLSKKYNCVRCGEVFCVRCITKHEIPGRSSTGPKPVCKPCFDRLVGSDSPKI